MLKKKKFFLSIAYIVILCLIININSTMIVEWLNKSLFMEYEMDTVNAKDSFYTGKSLIVVIMIFIYAIVGSIAVGVITTNIIFGLFIVANNIKMQERNEFITFSELQTITSPRELLSFVEISLSKAMIYSTITILLLILIHYIIRKITVKIGFSINNRFRLSLLIITASMLMVIYLKPNVYNKHILKYEETKVHNFNPLTKARKDGYLPSIIHTINPEYMKKPMAYTKTQVNNILSTYSESAYEINRNRDSDLKNSQTLLYLSETLIDPGHISDLLFNESPIPYFKSIQNNNIGGSMYSQYIGGGTANIEWSILTSFSLEAFNDPMVVTPYSDFYVHSKNHSSILGLFDTKKIALHPYTAHLYRRQSNYNALGFDEFLYLKNGIQHTEKLGTHYRVSDAALNKDIFRVMDDKDTGLLHILSMQNHSPYSQEISDMSYKPEINPEVFPDEKKKEMFNYLQGLKATDDAIHELIDKIESSDREVNLLLYGDHYPSLFRGLEEEFAGYVNETPWFLYMNNNRSEQVSQYEGLSPMFLVTVLLREGGYYVSPFQGLMDTLLSSDIKRIGSDFVVTSQGIQSDTELSAEVRGHIENYRIIMYDALFGSNWLSDDFYKVTEK